MSPGPFTTADADRLLGMADQCLDELDHVARKGLDTAAQAEAAATRVEWDSIRPLLVQAPALHALVGEALDTWADRFASDQHISGADLVEWFAQWLQRAQELPAAAPERVNATVGANHYRVGWEIDIYADTAEEAARKALAIQRNPASIATVFNVTGGPEPFEQQVDLSPEHGGELPEPRMLMQKLEGPS